MQIQRKVIPISNKLILDFDNTITNSTKRLCELYNEDFKNHPDFIPARWQYVYRWDCKDECPLVTHEKVIEYFDRPDFFDGLEFMDNAAEVINMLSEDFSIIAATMGTVINLTNKERYIRKVLPCIQEFIGCDSSLYPDKSHIDMAGAIFLDDHPIYLNSSNAKYKVLFGDFYEWNDNWIGVRCFNWYEFRRYVNGSVREIFSM